MLLRRVIRTTDRVCSRAIRDSRAWLHAAETRNQQLRARCQVNRNGDTSSSQHPATEEPAARGTATTSRRRREGEKELQHRRRVADPLAAAAACSRFGTRWIWPREWGTVVGPVCEAGCLWWASMCRRCSVLQHSAVVPSSALLACACRRCDAQDGSFAEVGCRSHFAQPRPRLADGQASGVHWIQVNVLCEAMQRSRLETKLPHSQRFRMRARCAVARCLSFALPHLPRPPCTLVV